MQKWEIGKTYKFIPEMVERFSATNNSNFQIAKILKGRQFIVEEVDDGRVINIQGIERFTPLDWWFYPEEIKYFREVNTSTSIDTAVIDWLDKLYYVMRNDNSVHEQLYFNSDGLVLTTDLCDIQGSLDIYNFIDGVYGEMQSKAEIKHKKELQSKREALLAELAEIDKQLGGK